jgi:hypothetical protein
MEPDENKTDLKKEKSAARDADTIRRDVMQLKILRVRLSALNVYFADEETRKKGDVDLSPLIAETIGILDHVVASLEPLTQANTGTSRTRMVK